MVETKDWKFKPSQDAPLELHAVSVCSEAPTCVLIVNHGIAEHSGRYKHFFDALAAKGIDVHSFDMRGHGKSEPNPKERCKVAFDDLVNDLWAFYESVQERYADKQLPCYVMGHSLGGLIAATVVLRRQDDFAGLILSSPALDVEWNLMLRIQAPMGSVLSAVTPWAAIVPAVRVEDLSEDPKVREEYVQDPLNVVGNLRARTANSSLQGQRKLRKRYAEVTLPVYGIHGAHDRCTSLPAHKRFIAEISSKDKTLNVFEGGYHELLMGPQKAAATDAIGDWIAARGAQQATEAPSRL